MVRFLRAGGVNFLVDQEGLKTGRVLLVEFQANGQIQVEMLRRPFSMIPVMRYLMGLDWNVRRLNDENVGGAEWSNEPLVTSITCFFVCIFACGRANTD